MGWSSRLRNGIARAISPQPTISRGPAKQSVNINRLHNHMNMSEIMPGFSQPVWGPEIDTIGGYSREGYTSKPFDLPAIPFRVQALALQADEDVQYTVNKLAAQVTGGEHYLKTSNDNVTEYLSKFSKDISFDSFDTILIKELLWFGNSVWKPRMGIRNVKTFDDLMHVPISSFQRVWWDRQRQPYKYEFRGAEYQGYHNPGELLVFNWNPVDASVFGTGFGIALTSTREFEMVVSGDETIPKRLPSMLDRKLATQFIMQMSTQRYVPRNVYTAPGVTEEQRSVLQSDVQKLDIGEDLVAGSSLTVQELGTNTRAFDPAQFTEMTAAPIRKGLHDFSTKQAGESSHTFANADTAKEESESEMTAFTIHVKTQLQNKLFKPWYEANPQYQWTIFGLEDIPWSDLKFDLNFGHVEKTDISVENMIKLIEIYMQTPIIKDPKVIHRLFERAGLDLGDYQNMIYDDPAGDMALANMGQQQSPQSQQQQDPSLQLPPNSDMGGGAMPNMWNNMNVGSPPMDNSIYDSMSMDIRGPLFIPTNYQRGNQAQDFNFGRNYE